MEQERRLGSRSSTSAFEGRVVSGTIVIIYSRLPFMSAISMVGLCNRTFSLSQPLLNHILYHWLVRVVSLTKGTVWAVRGNLGLGSSV